MDVTYTCVKGAIHGVWGSKHYDCGINDMVLKELLAWCVCWLSSSFSGFAVSFSILD